MMTMAMMMVFLSINAMELKKKSIRLHKWSNMFIFCCWNKSHLLPITYTIHIYNLHVLQHSVVTALHIMELVCNRFDWWFDCILYVYKYKYTVSSQCFKRFHWMARLSLPLGTFNSCVCVCVCVAIYAKDSSCFSLSNKQQKQHYLRMKPIINSKNAVNGRLHLYFITVCVWLVETEVRSSLFFHLEILGPEAMLWNQHISMVCMTWNKYALRWDRFKRSRKYDK